MSDIIDLKLNSSTWDLELINNDIKYVSDTEAIEQHLKQRLQFFRGEYPFDLSRGIPFHDYFFKKNFNPIIIDSSLKNTIIDTPGIRELKQFSLSLNESIRELTVEFKALAITGEIINYSGDIPLG